MLAYICMQSSQILVIACCIATPIRSFTLKRQIMMNISRPRIGTNIGDLTDEVPPDSEITHFFSVGPKSYSLKYRRANGEVYETITILTGDRCLHSRTKRWMTAIITNIRTPMLGNNPHHFVAIFTLEPKTV